jgi:uncharacterized protein (DUF58 family)
LELSDQELETLKNLSVLLKRSRQGFFSGKHSSRRTGSGTDFNEYQLYQNGQDLRSVDWKMVAKTGKAYVKHFDEENFLETSALLDTSPSMLHSFSSSTQVGKMKTAATFLFYLSQLARLGEENFNFFSSGNRKWPHQLTANDEAAFWQVTSMFSEMATSLPQPLSKEPIGGWAEEMDTLRSSLGSLKKKTQIYWVSDFYFSKENLESMLNHFKNQGVLVHLVHIEDREELRGDFSSAPSVLLTDAETGKREIFEKSKMQKAYREALLEHVGSLNAVAKKYHFHYFGINNEQAVFPQFLKVVGFS